MSEIYLDGDSRVLTKEMGRTSDPEISEGGFGEDSESEEWRFEEGSWSRLKM